MLTNQYKTKILGKFRNGSALFEPAQRSVDLTNLPKAAPIRDLFEVIDTRTISALPPNFWTLPKNCAHFEKQVMLLLENNATITVPKPTQKKTQREKRLTIIAINVQYVDIFQVKNTVQCVSKCQSSFCQLTALKFSSFFF